MIPNDPPESGGVRRRRRSPFEPERGGRDAVQRERSLEVGPGRQSAGGRVPVGDDRAALDGGAGEAGNVECLPDDEVGLRHRVVDVAVRERPVVHRMCCGGNRVENGVERVVVDLDELGRILGQVTIPGDDDGDGLADVAHRVDRGCVLRHAGLDPGRERSRQRGDVGAGEDADDPGQPEGPGRVDLDPGVREL